jgi:hypothetical protein
MSSIITAVPSGPIQDWCIQVPWFGLDNAPQQCANATRGTTESDFETISCDGSIVDTSKDIFSGGPIDLADLVCCRIQGPVRVSTSPTLRPGDGVLDRHAYAAGESGGDEHAERAGLSSHVHERVVWREYDGRLYSNKNTLLSLGIYGERCRDGECHGAGGADYDTEQHLVSRGHNWEFKRRRIV